MSYINSSHSRRPGRVPASVFGALALLLVAGLGVWYFTRSGDAKSSLAKSLPKGEVISVEQIKGYDPKFTDAELALLRKGATEGDAASARDYGLLLARLEPDPEIRLRRVQMIIGIADGYGSSEPIADVSPQARSVAEALKTKKFPERLSPAIAPKPFDAAAYAANPKAYLDVAEPGRVFQGKPPGAGVPAIASISPYAQSVEQGKMVELSVKAAPGYPVTFTSMDLGRFKESGLVTVTVPADASGVATVHFEGVPGTILDSTVLASSPMTSGRVRFKMTTLVKTDTRPVASN